MLRKNIIVLVGIFFSIHLFAQQEPHYTQNMFNTMAVNPAFAGSVPAISITGILRQQWVGFKEEGPEGIEINVAPQTYLVSIHSPVKILRGGVGGIIQNDELGYTRNISVKLGYARIWKIKKLNAKFSVGAQFGFINTTIDYGKLSDLANQPGDPVLSGSKEEGSLLFDFAGGFYFSVPKQFHIGISSSQLRQAKYTQNSETGEVLGFSLARHYYLSAGYELNLPGRPDYRLKPSVFFQTDGKHPQYNFSAMLEYKEKIWGGLSYRFQDAISPIFGFIFKDIKVGYAYDVGTTGIGSLGSHEVMLNYNFNIEVERPKKNFKNTRYL